MNENKIIVLGYQVKRLIEKRSERIMREYGLRRVELDILMFLHCSAVRNTAKDIMQEEHISKAHISKSVENLRQRGFIVLSEDPQDHRIWHIDLTERAKQAAEEVKAVREACRSVIYRGISQERLDMMEDVLADMIENTTQELER